MKSMIATIIFSALTLASVHAAEYQLSDAYGRIASANFKVDITSGSGNSWHTSSFSICIKGGRVTPAGDCDSGKSCSLVFESPYKVSLEAGQGKLDIGFAEGSTGWYGPIPFSQITLKTTEVHVPAAEPRLTSIQCMKSMPTKWSLKEVRATLGNLVTFE